MSDKAKRLAALVQELRGSLSQGQFAKKLGVVRSTVTFWESGQAYPDAENLQKLAHVKGWNLEELQNYLLEGESPSEEPLEQILRKVRTLPSAAVIQVVNVGVQTLAARMESTEVSVKT
jgi:transcriptional regulator with XRE-family HTH domain